MNDTMDLFSGEDGQIKEHKFTRGYPDISVFNLQQNCMQHPGQNKAGIL